MKRTSPRSFAIIAALCGLSAGAVEPDRTRLPDNVELAAGVFDELGNHVPGGRVVAGETVLIRATLTDLETLEARRRLDAARLRDAAVASGAVPGAGNPRAAQAEQALAQAERRLAERPLAERFAVLAATLRGDAGVVDVAMSEVRLPRADVLEQLARGARTERRWAARTGDLAPGRYRAVLTLELDGRTYTVEAGFELVAAATATAEERARGLAIPALRALRAGQHADAARLAAAAADVADPLGEQRMRALRIRGDALYALNDRPGALAAYRDAVAIAQAAFPKSNLPQVLAPRMRRLASGAQPGATSP